MKRESDLSGFVCPLSKMKAIAEIDNLEPGESLTIVLGDAESLKSVARELKERGIRPNFEQEAENRFVVTIMK